MLGIDHRYSVGGHATQRVPPPPVDGGTDGCRYLAVNPTARFRLWRTIGEAVVLVRRAAPGDLTRAVLSELVAAAALAITLFSGREVVELLTDARGSETADLLPPVLVLGAALVVSGVAQVATREYRVLIAERTVRAVQDEIVDIATSVDFERYEAATFHDLLQRANTQAVQSAHRIVFDLLALLNVLTTSAAVVVVLATTVPEVLLALVLVAVPFGIAARASAQLGFRVNYELTTPDRLRSYLYRALTGKPSAKEVRVFGLANPLHVRWSRLYDDRVVRIRSLARRRLLFNGLAALASSALVAAVLLVLVDAALAERISLADAAVAIVALQQLAVRIRTATTATGSLRGSALYLHDFDQLRTLRGNGAPPLADEPLSPAALEVDSVAFTYPGTEREVLHDVSLRIEPGEVVALVGVSGSGKTTLSNLVAGLYEPTTGTVTYGGQPISDLDPARYRRTLGVVFQDYERYEMSARENIAVSDELRMDDVGSVVSAAERAGIADVIEQLPMGYETMLSRSYDDGAELSVGQWQRIAVARAFFRNSPLLILDEPAAALDAIAEQELFERLRELATDRSVLMISHRFSTVRLADRILVMQAGRIIERGTHEELIELNGTYRELFTMQARGFLPEAMDR